MNKAALLADMATLYKVVGIPEILEPPVLGVTPYIVNVMEVGLSQDSKKPTAYRKNVQFYVYNEGLGDESAYYQREEPKNTSNTDVTMGTSSYQAIANLYNSTALQQRVLSAIITQCSSVFQESVTSSTSLTIGTGSKSLTVTTGYPAGIVQYNWGLQLIISNNGNSMTGNVTSYNPSTGALVVNVTSVSGSGTFTSWTVVPTNHANRMKLVSQANTTLSNVVLRFMSAVALNSDVQAAGTGVADSVLFSIINGSWDSFASLIVA